MTALKIDSVREAPGVQLYSNRYRGQQQAVLLYCVYSHHGASWFHIEPSQYVETAELLRARVNEDLGLAHDCMFGGTIDDTGLKVAYRRHRDQLDNGQIAAYIVRAFADPLLIEELGLGWVLTLPVIIGPNPFRWDCLRNLVEPFHHQSS